MIIHKHFVVYVGAARTRIAVDVILCFRYNNG